MPPRRRHARRTGLKQLPGWVLVLLGLTLGVTSVLLTQIIVKRAGSTDGLAGLFASRRAPAPRAPAAAKPAAPKPKLDFYTVLPEIETLLPDHGAHDKSAAEHSEPGASYILQVGSFASFEEADQLKARLALQGMHARIQKVVIQGKGEYHRVRLGPYKNLEDLDTANRRLSKLGIKGLRLKLKTGPG